MLRIFFMDILHIEVTPKLKDIPKVKDIFMLVKGSPVRYGHIYGGGGGVERDQISDIRPPKNPISDIRPPEKKSNI